MQRTIYFLLQSRWAVAVTVAAVVVWRHDDGVYWAVIGGLLNAASSKFLKRVFNQQRPLTALGLKDDPGMPSSHAQSLGFFSLYASFGCTYHNFLLCFLGLQSYQVLGLYSTLACIYHILPRCFVYCEMLKM